MNKREFRFTDDADALLVVQRDSNGEGVWVQVRDRIASGFVLLPMDKAREMLEQLRQMTEAQP